MINNILDDKGVNMSKYKISLIIPCFNAEKYLNYAFNSVKNQTFGFDKIETIFVYDTSSTDSTLTILKSFKDEFSSIKLIKFDNPLHTAGLPRNEGLKHVTSDYIIFLDSDDALEPDAVEILYNTIKEYDVDIVKSNFSLLVNNKKIKLNSTSNKPIIIKPHSSDLSKISDDIIWATIYKFNFLKNKNIKFSDSILGEDTLFIANCLISTDNDIILLDNFHSVIYTSDNFNSHSHTISLEKLKDNIDVHMQIVDLYLETNQDISLIKNTLKRFVLNSISNTLRSDESDNNKKVMVGLVHTFIIKYEDLIPNFSFIWSILYYLFKNSKTNLILVVSYMTRIFFNSNILSKLQLVIRRQGWKTLKRAD